MAYISFQPKDHFNTILNTGDGTTNKSFTGVGFQPDLVWNKIRSTTYGHWLYDAVRGAGAEKEISSNTNSAQGASDNQIYGYISSFDSDGFSVTGSSNSAYFNQNNETYVNWNWKANGAGSSNTDGSITSTVSANTTSGFSIVKYTGTGSAATIGHGLGVAPKMIIAKNLGDARSWGVYHASLGATQPIDLDGTGAAFSSSTYWNNTSPTTSVFSTGGGNNTGSAFDFIAYCFAEKKGFSKFGSYTGNGSADGTFIFTGFKPAFVIFKKTSATGNWGLLDSTRSYANVANHTLAANLSDAESSFGGGESVFGASNKVDIVSNGIKIREASDYNNASGATYIYLAFAESPIVSSNGVPATAR